MYSNKLDELEVVIMEKRLAILKNRGLTGQLMFDLKDDFFELMADSWTFDHVITSIHGLQEMNSQERDDAIGETLPPLRKKRGRKSKAELESARLAAEAEEDEFEDI